MKPRPMEAVINRKRYSTQTATLIASNAFWDGNNWERSGRNAFLYRTPRGGYFVARQTCWQGERDSLSPLSEDEAIEMFENMPVQEVDFSSAFPEVTVEDA